MMIEWFLIMSFVGGVQAAEVPFLSREACISAKEIVLEVNKTEEREIIAVCLPRERN